MWVRLYCHFSYHLSIGFCPFSLPLPLFQKYTESLPFRQPLQHTYLHYRGSWSAGPHPAPSCISSSSSQFHPPSWGCSLKLRVGTLHLFCGLCWGRQCRTLHGVIHPMAKKRISNLTQCNTIQLNPTHPNATQHNTAQCSSTQSNATQHN